MRYLPLAVFVLGLGCTNDYDQFTFGGGSPGTGGTPGTGGSSGPTGGQSTSNGGAPSTGGEGGMGGTPTTDGGMGGMPGTGGMPPGVEVPCGGETCNVDAGEECCIDNDGAPFGTCKSNCAGFEASLECNEPADCPGQLCCLDDSGGNLDGSHCGDFCGDEELCDPANPDCGGGDCVQHPDLPDGYFFCD
ncbi:MAG: hypothetical protein HOW73_23455 [Polyangiaceae bacterium]|nr:hypothetical protein [Polyangiaceae bacterium]